MLSHVLSQSLKIRALLRAGRVATGRPPAPLLASQNNTSRATRPLKMQIFVGVPAGAGRVKAGQKLTLEVESDWSVDRLKEQISAEHGILPAAQRLSFMGEEIVGHRKLADYEIRLEAELQLVQALQVHKLKVKR